MYIDGFNLYYAVAELNENYLKWADLWRLSNQIIAKQSEELVKVVFCTAYYPGDHSKRIRHELFKRALEVSGVACMFGHYIHEPMDCHACGHEWSKATEKETDINVALALFDDAYQGVFDHAYLLSADSDQAATAKMFKTRFPEKRLTSVVPPGREPSKSVMAHADARILLTRDHFERVVMPGMIESPGGLIVRPHEYDPPAGWVHPDKRPK
jgi:uncharacterized LabA/DUF88 family protein